MRKILLLSSILLLSITLVGQQLSTNQVIFPEPEKLTYEQLRFGQSMASYGDYVAISNYALPINSAIYIYKNNNGSLTKIAKLTRSVTDLSEKDVGRNIVMNDDFIMIHAKKPDGKGIVYVYDKPESGWIDMTETRIIEAPEYDKDNCKSFGISIAINNNTVAIAGEIDKKGCVYVYEKSGNTWNFSTPNAKLIPSTSSENDYFGRAIKVENNVIMCGQTRYNSNKGAVCVYKKPVSGWHNASETLKIDAPVDGKYFGNAIDIEGNTIVIATYRSKIGSSNDAGAVYIYENQDDTWTNITKQAKITIKDIEQGSYFGLDLILNNNTIFTSSIKSNNSSIGKGFVFIHKKPDTGWADAQINHTLEDSNGVNQDRFGQTMVISKNNLLVAAFEKDDTEENTGAVFVYKNNETSWVPEDTPKINAPENYLSNKNYKFGKCLASYGNYIVVSKQSGTNECADIYKMDNNRWNKIAELSITDYTNDIYSIDMDESVIAIGTRATGSNGYVYLFEKTGNEWTDMTETKRLDLNNKSNNYFGRSLSISSNILAVGATGTDSNSGSVVIYEKPVSGWANITTPIATLTASVTRQRIGYDVYLDDNTIVTGAPFATINGTKTGAVYIFEKPESGWTDMTETTIITPDDGTADDYFGMNLDVNNNKMVVISERHNNSIGAAYIFEKSGDSWTTNNQVAKLQKPADKTRQYNFGKSVLFDDNDILIGEPVHPNGYIYKYAKPESGWINSNTPEIIEPKKYIIYIGFSLTKTPNGYISGAYRTHNSGTEAGAIVTIEKEINVSTQVGANGSIILPDKIFAGDNTTVIFKPNNGYGVSSATYNGNNITNDLELIEITGDTRASESEYKYQYTIENTPASLSITGQFDTAYEMKSSTNSGGNVYNKPLTIINSNFTYNIVPKSHYILNKVQYNNIDIPVNLLTETDTSYLYTVNSVTEDGILNAEFIPIYYNINIQQKENGTIATSDGNTITNAETKTITITPDKGYTLGSLTINGNTVSPVQSGNSYTYNLSNVTEDISVVPTFTPIIYNITIVSGNNGSASVNGGNTITVEDNKTLTITPDNGYTLNRLLINNSPVEAEKDGDNFTYNLSGISENITIGLLFKAKEYTVTVNTGDNGSASKVGNKTITIGDDLTITITPNKGYRISKAMLNNTNIIEQLVQEDDTYKYTIQNISSDMTVDIEFAAIPYNIVVEFNEGGTVTPSGSTTATIEDVVQFTLRVNEGYKLTSATLNDVTITENLTLNNDIYTYNLNDIDRDYTLKVQFDKKQTSDINGYNTGNIKLWPNPASGFIQITLENTENNSTVKIINTTGNTVYLGRYSNGLIDISNLPVGVYTLQVIGRDNINTAIFIKK
jgi:hypothetical protein